MAGAPTVADVGEFGLIAELTSRLEESGDILVGPGDDAAVLATRSGSVVASTDLLLEGRHFRRDWSTAEDIGRKAAARNFSDIAAMGAVPTALLIGLACPPTTEVAWLQGVMTGILAECGEVGASVIGGDVSSADTVLFSVTALGDLYGREPVRMSGARPGDVVAIVGRLGWAAAGFAVLSRGFRSPVQVANAHRRPEPPYAAGPAAAESGATSMTDVSDGLVADLRHVAAQSGVRIELASGPLTPAPRLREVGSALNVDPMTWVLDGGDDYPLVATFPSALQIPAGWLEIGAVVEGEGVRLDGRPLTGGGHEHFR